MLIFRAISFPGSSPITRHREREGQWTIEDIRKWSFDFVFFFNSSAPCSLSSNLAPKDKKSALLENENTKQTNKQKRSSSDANPFRPFTVPLKTLNTYLSTHLPTKEYSPKAPKP